MKIVILFGGKQWCIVILIMGMQRNNIVVIFGSQMNGFVGNVFLNMLCDFNQYMSGVIVFNLIDSVKV